ncbi:precorrin-3B synthase [Iningainema tapete]|uniref:precorrin-3B synthase n=1 Tax=Iningainema tapete TaxID=2806730 RepID=UPI001EE2FFF1|nr:precorrin-3B synthase [Iningainema tapete]
MSFAHSYCLPNLQQKYPTCPGLFYDTGARDGIISRLRVPGGILNSKQGRVVVEWASCGRGYVHVTNRANLQIRANQGITDELLTILQQSGLAAPLACVDHLRNIMASPTAGIDLGELIDTRPLVKELDEYICLDSELAGLSPKFSVGFNGGGSVSISEQPNEIGFLAVAVDGYRGTYFRLKLGEEQNIIVKPEECLPVVVALARVYLSVAGTSHRPRSNLLKADRQLRIKHILQEWGVQWYLNQAQRYLPFAWRYILDKTFPKTVFTPKNLHLGVHQQRQPGLYYIGVVLPLGQLLTNQLRSLVGLADTYGSGTLRLTPWQNLLISDIPAQDVPKVQLEIERLGLHWSASHIQGTMVACTGKNGCRSSATDTKGHGLALAEYLQKHITLDVPVRIHLSGCPKSCAYHGKSDITLLGTIIEDIAEGYHIYVGDGEQPFGRELYTNVPWTELGDRIRRMLQVYHQERQPHETFGAFSNRYMIQQLRQLFDERGRAR